MVLMVLVAIQIIILKGKNMLLGASHNGLTVFN